MVVVFGGSVPTPNIDSIASAGIHFPNGYAGNATCAPSRAALLTGRFGTRSGFEFTPVNPQMARFTNTLTPTDDFIEENAVNYPPVESLGLPASELTIPEMLDAEGHHSGIAWHLGRVEGIKPLIRASMSVSSLREVHCSWIRMIHCSQFHAGFDPIDKYHGQTCNCSLQ